MTRWVVLSLAEPLTPALLGGLLLPAAKAAGFVLLLPRPALPGLLSTAAVWAVLTYALFLLHGFTDPEPLQIAAGFLYSLILGSALKLAHDSAQTVGTLLRNLLFASESDQREPAAFADLYCLLVWAALLLCDGHVRLVSLLSHDPTVVSSVDGFRLILSWLSDTLRFSIFVFLPMFVGVAVPRLAIAYVSAQFRNHFLDASMRPLVVVICLLWLLICLTTCLSYKDLLLRMIVAAR